VGRFGICDQSHNEKNKEKQGECRETVGP